MKKLPQNEKAVLQTVCLYPRQLENLRQYAKDNNINSRGVPSISGALQHILGAFFNGG